MPDEPVPAPEAPVAPTASALVEPFTITKDTPIEAVNAHMFPKNRVVPGLGFELPNVVVATDGNHFTFRNGSVTPAQLEHEIEDWFSFEEAKDFPMGIRRLSPFAVAGRTVPVLDDKSLPTAADYLSELGKRTLWEFSSVPMPMKPGSLPSIFERPVWKNRRVWVTLPPP